MERSKVVDIDLQERLYEQLNLTLLQFIAQSEFVSENQADDADSVLAVTMHFRQAPAGVTEPARTRSVPPSMTRFLGVIAADVRTLPPLYKLILRAVPCQPLRFSPDGKYDVGALAGCGRRVEERPTGASSRGVAALAKGQRWSCVLLRRVKAWEQRPESI